MMDLTTIPSFYKRYIDNVVQQPLLAALRDSNAETLSLVRTISVDKKSFRYAADKWSIVELLCHMIDAERIFAYRALRFARNDKTPLPGFEENDYAPESNASARSLADIADEMERLRHSTIDLFTSFSPEMLQRSGSSNNTVLTVEAIGYIIAGHEVHHRNILKQRYLTNP